jgi:RHH-type rel operon transcriptional repressor/antitoxin RelB
MGMPQDAIALPPDLERRVRKLAAETGMSPGRIMVDAIADYVADLEDGRVAEERLQALRDGKSDTVPLETLLSRYGLAD